MILWAFAVITVIGSFSVTVVGIIAVLRYRDEHIHGRHEDSVKRCAEGAAQNPNLMGYWDWHGPHGPRLVRITPEMAPDLGMSCQCRPCARGRRSLPRATLVRR